MKNLKRKMRRTRTWSSDSGFCDPGILDQEDFPINNGANAVLDLIEKAITVALDELNDDIKKKFKILKNSFKDYCGDSCRSEEELLRILHTKINKVVSESADVAKNKIQDVLGDQVQNYHDLIVEEDDFSNSKLNIGMNVDPDLMKTGADVIKQMIKNKRKAEAQLQQRFSKHQKLCYNCGPLDVAADDADDDFTDWDWSSDEWEHEQEDAKDKTETFFNENQKLLLKYYDDQTVDNQWNYFNFWKIDIEDVENLDYDILGIEIGVNDLYAFHDPQAQDLLMISDQEEIKGWEFWNYFGSVQNILEAYEAIKEVEKPDNVKRYSKKMISEFCDKNCRNPERKMKRNNQEKNS